MHICTEYTHSSGVYLGFLLKSQSPKETFLRRQNISTLTKQMPSYKIHTFLTRNVSWPVLRRNWKTKHYRYYNNFEPFQLFWTFLDLFNTVSIVPCIFGAACARYWNHQTAWHSPPVYPLYRPASRPPHPARPGSAPRTPAAPQLVLYSRLGSVTWYIRNWKKVIIYHLSCSVWYFPQRAGPSANSYSLTSWHNNSGLNNRNTL